MCDRPQLLSESGSWGGLSSSSFVSGLSRNSGDLGGVLVTAADHTVYGYGRTLYDLYTAISVPSSVPYASTSVTLTVQYMV